MTIAYFASYLIMMISLSKVDKRNFEDHSWKSKKSVIWIKKPCQLETPHIHIRRWLEIL